MSETQQDRPRPRWWQRLAGRRDEHAAAWSLYRAAVAQARAPRFYRELGVADTPDGRFELVALHTALLMRRLQAAGPAGHKLAEAVSEAMMSDMDRSVREMGVGDLSVAKWVRRMGESLLSRLVTLDRALAHGDAAPIVLMLQRNLPGVGDRPPAFAAIAGLLMALDRELAALPAAELLAGRLTAAPVP